MIAHTYVYLSLLLALFHSFSSAWVAPLVQLHPASKTSQRFMSNEETGGSYTVDTSGIPCWQDIYDDDCGMSTIYSAAFIAKDWIKSMPCAAGIEDCDMEDLKIPSAHNDPGIDQVDVMSFLQLKRAAPLKKKNNGDSSAVAP
mmetsp:Transcript_16495/g.33802  ORF Transcript_16495/g.33802 Transcript_16495/m.33802 type:complete len:143 (-) Transcript_16495:81-509(-)